MIVVGQTWVSPGGVSYTIEQAIEGGFEVSILDGGPITASNGRWEFTPDKLRNLIEAEQLRLYDASAALDRFAEQLEQQNLVVLAAALDSISAEYVEARNPNRLRNDRIRRAEEQLEALQRRLEDAQDPENRELIIEEIENTLKDIEKIGDKTSDDIDISPIDPISVPEKIGRPGGISKP